MTHFENSDVIMMPPYYYLGTYCRLLTIGRTF